jgi:hypothetical protein
MLAVVPEAGKSGSASNELPPPNNIEANAQKTEQCYAAGMMVEDRHAKQGSKE